MTPITAVPGPSATGVPLRRSAPRRSRVAVLTVAAVVLATATALGVHARSAGTVSTPFLSYSLPVGWTADGPDGNPDDPRSLTGTAHGPAYECGGERYVRGFAAAALLPADAAQGSGPADRAERLARWFAAESYGPAPEVTVAPARPVRIAGPRGPVDGTVTEVGVRATGQAADRADCAATGGTAVVLAAAVSGGAALLLVAGDTEGGPADPAPPDRAALDAVLAGARLTAV